MLMRFLNTCNTIKFQELKTIVDYFNNTLAYCVRGLITTVERFIILGPGELKNKGSTFLHLSLYSTVNHSQAEFLAPKK
jgi:hypothetical protein